MVQPCNGQTGEVVLSGFFAAWQAQRQQQRLHVTQAAWWTALHESRPPCWMVTIDPAHQPVVSGLLDQFWTGLEQASTLPALVQALADWDQQAKAVLHREDVPEGVRREVQTWRTASQPGDMAGIQAVLEHAYQHRREILDGAQVTGLVRPQRTVPEETTLQRWRDTGERFGYTHVSSSVMADSTTWRVLLDVWTRSHTIVAQRLNEPDHSLGAGRWAAHLSQRTETGGGFEPVTRSIGVAFRPVNAVLGGGMDDAPDLDDPDGLAACWVQVLAHERGHALDFWLGERSTAAVHPLHGALDRLGFVAAHDGHPWRFDTESSVQVRVPMSGRQGPLSAWLDLMRGNLRFINGCLGMDGHAPYLLRSSEIAARFWEGLVRTFETPPSRTDMTFPNLAMTDDEQQALRDTLLRAAGLPLRRDPGLRLDVVRIWLNEPNAIDPSRRGSVEPVARNPSTGPSPVG